MKRQLSMLMLVGLLALAAGGCAARRMESNPLPPAGGNDAGKTVTVNDEKKENKDATIVTPPVVTPDVVTPPADLVVTPPVLSDDDLNKKGVNVQPEVKKLTLESVYFDFNRAVLTQSAQDAIARDFAKLSAVRDSYVLEGYCDEVGEDNYNMALGQARAEAVQQYLQKLGIAPKRLSVVSYGLEYPADPGHDEAAHAKNRRVELWVKGTPPPGQRQK